MAAVRYHAGRFPPDDRLGWCRFFLEAVRVQAEDNLTKARSVFDAHL